MEHIHTKLLSGPSHLSICCLHDKLITYGEVPEHHVGDILVSASIEHPQKELAS